jgi:hypothetical protein
MVSKKENIYCQEKVSFCLILGWIFGLISIVIMKLIYLIVFFIVGHHSSALTSTGISKTISNHVENSPDEISFPSIKYHLWLGLGFNAFTCGIILGTTIYHLIPHVYKELFFN